MKRNFPKKRKIILLLAVLLMATLFPSKDAAAQKPPAYMRIARIVVDSSQVESYKLALKEGMEAAVRLEPGVLSLNAVYDKKKPGHITVFEIYASMDAYNSHIQTPHFKKYKAAVADMVKSLELVDVEPIANETKMAH